MASASSLPAGGMCRAAPVKAAKISCGELSQYRSRSALNGGGRPLAIARAIRLAYSSVGEDFGWARLIVLLANHGMIAGSRMSGLVKVREIHCTRSTANLHAVARKEHLLERTNGPAAPVPKLLSACSSCGAPNEIRSPIRKLVISRWWPRNGRRPLGTDVDIAVGPKIDRGAAGGGGGGRGPGADHPRRRAAKARRCRRGAWSQSGSAISSGRAFSC